MFGYLLFYYYQFEMPSIITIELKSSFLLRIQIFKLEAALVLPRELIMKKRRERKSNFVSRQKLNYG